MAAIINEKSTTQKQSLNNAINSQTMASFNQADANNQLLLPSKFVLHTPKAGLNPLVDAGAYLFSIMGRLKNIKSYRMLGTLRSELIQEINIFQESAKSHGYSGEYIVFSRYALCAALDDIIANTPWGTKGQWSAHCLLNTFNHGALSHESMSQERFFVILERLVSDPNLYIDIMEFMYICLSLGFKGRYRGTEFNKTQLENIINALYKHIRAYRGDFSKTLSPFPLKTPAPIITTYKTRKLPIGLTIVATALLTTGIVFGLFTGFKSLLDTSSSHVLADLTQTGKSITL